MKFFSRVLLGLLVLVPAAPLAGQSVAEAPQDYAREMYFRWYLADCGPDEIRWVWFHDNDLQIGLRLTVNLRDGSVESVRDVFDWAEQNLQRQPGELNSEKIAALRQLTTALPPSQEVFPMAECVLIAQRDGDKVQIHQYNRIAPPAFVQTVYDLCKSYIVLGEADLRDNVVLTGEETSRFSAFARPWSAPRVLDWYQQAKTLDERKFWAHVLAVSRDPRAALALEKNLGQGDNSADLRDFVAFFSGSAAEKDKQSVAEAQKWLQANHPRLEAQAAILSGHATPSDTQPVIAPPCPEANYHEVSGSHGDYDEATVTIDNTGLAHIALKRPVPVERDFQLNAELVGKLRELIDQADFFTTAEPATGPASGGTGTTELAITLDGRKRTVHETWLPPFAPLRNYFSQLIYLAAKDSPNSSVQPIDPVSAKK